MAQLDDKTLQNLNKRLKEMDEILASDYRKALDLGKAFTQGFSTEQIDAFLRKLGKINRADAAKLNVMFNLVDRNGKPITVEYAKKRVEQIRNAIELVNKNPNFGSQLKFNATQTLTNELKRYKDALSVLGMSTSQQFDLISRNVKRVNNEVKGLRKGFGDMLPTLQRLASAFGVAFSVRGLAQFGKKLIETRGEFERQQVALRSILQNKQLADEIWDKTMQAALQSPFTAMQLTTYTKQLAAYRIETDKLFETTKRLADVSAGLGVDMQRLILAYGQVKAANYLRASEIRQFTEAGVNVLGELRDYFNDVKGMSVDTAQVMEMVTKRLVTFEDVEAIFKRMTDQGGIFYEMQYVQSQTVRGQIAKLHDAYDQMLNSIGQANEGALKTMVSLLNSIVKNWQEFKTVIDLIAWPLLISFVYKFSRGLMTTAASSVATSASMNKLTVAGARTQLMFKRLFATIAANPFIALGAAVAAVGVALLNHAKHVRDINKRYEDLMLRTYETQKNLNGLSETIQNNLETMKEAAKGSKAYNEASRENENIVKKLKDQYPELLQDIDLQKDGYGKLIEKIKEYNEELENNIRLEYAARAGFWQDDLTTNIADLQEAQRKREMQFLQNRELAERRYLELKAQGKEAEEDIWNKRIRLAKDWQEQVDIINQQNEAARGSQNPYGEGISIGDWSLQMRGFVAPIGDVERNKANLSSNIKQEALVFNDIIRDQLKTISEDLGDDIQQFITDNETQINELFKDKEGAGWKLLNKQITKFFTAKGATDKETRESIQNLLNEYLLIPIQLDWDNIGDNSGSTTPPQTSGNKTKENASKLISLIKEMRSEYDKLSKSAYGYAKSQDKVRQSYEDSVREILGEAGVGIDYDFTTNEGMIDALEKVKSFVQGSSKYAKDAWKDVQKYIDQLETEIEINAQVRIREDFGKQMEKAFGDYELTIELEKLNISPEAAKDWLNFDYTSLGDMLNAMNDFANKLIEKNDFDEEDAKAYQQWAKKIEDQIYKARKEKAKEYSKYLETELSERAKLEMEYAKKVSEVKASPAFQGEQEEAILNNMNREFNEKLQELTWKSFKESDFYVEMMEDLTSIPAEYSALMLTKLNEILMHPEKLSPRALKEAINARQKIMEARRQMNPALAMSENLRSYREFYTNQGNRDEFGLSAKTSKAARKEIQALIIDKSKELSQLEEEINIYDDLIGEIENYNNLKKEYDEKSQGLAGDPEEEISQRQELLECLEYEQQRYEDLRDAKQRGMGIYEEEFNGLAKEINVRQQNITQLNAEIKAYRDAEVARKALGTAYANLSENAQNLIGGGEIQIGSTSGITSGNIKSKRQATADKKDNTKSAIQRLKDARKNEVEFAKAWHEFNAQLNDTIGKVKNMGNAFYDTFEALGGETDALTEGWKEFGNAMVDVITKALEMLPTLVTGFTAAGIEINSAMGIIGLIAEAIQLVLALITGLAKLHDAGYEAEIERQQKKIDELQRAYDRLEKQIEKTWDTASYIRTYNEETKNLYEQIEALNKQIAAEESKKNTDADKIQGYKDSIQDAEDELEELKQKQIEVFGGIGEEGYRDAAQGFVDAWKSAFLETGDGLQGLQDHFDEFLQDWFAKQATMQGVAKYYQKVFDYINGVVEDGSVPTRQEIENARLLADEAALKSDELMQAYASIFGLGGEGSLSGLAAGIQGMTEEQANILEAYWNTVMGNTISINDNVAAIVGLLRDGAGGIGGGGGKGNIFGDPNVNTNPMLQQLSLIAANTQATHQLLQSVAKSGHSQGGYGIKVFAD